MIRLIILFCVGAALIAPAEAQSRRELAARIDAMEARMAEIEAQALAGDPVAERLITRLDALEREQRALTGQIEQLEFENRRLREELERTGADVDRLFEMGPPPQAFADPEGFDAGADAANPDRFAEERAAAVRPLQLPGAPGSAPASAAPQLSAQQAEPVRREPVAPRAAPMPAPVTATTLASPDTLFMEGRSRLFDGDFAGAQESFQSFTESYPDDGLAGEAWYWLGETYFVQGDHADAADSYLASLRIDGRGPKAPDAGVRLAASFAALGRTSQACELLAGFQRQFPNADAEARRKAQREAARAGCN
ncbi:MAG: tol-pal system protein YbgF [Pseudomonadota bacterium]